jgi:hypothetical protein
MKSLESRIEGAVQAAADEVRPEDIPPLRLHAQPRGLRLRPGAPGFGGFRRLRGVTDSPSPGPRGRGPQRIKVTRPPSSANRWLAPLAAAVSLAAVVACLVVLRHAEGARPDGSWPASATVTRAQRLLVKEALDAYFPATGAQYTAGLTFAWTRQMILAAKAGPCLTQAGFPPRYFPRSERRYQLSFPDNGQFPDLNQRLRTHMMAPAGGDVRSDRARPWAHGDQRNYASAAQTCMEQYTHSLWRLDKIAGPLAGAWLKEVTTIQSSAPVRAKRPGFADCLESFGVPARFATSRGTDIHRLFTGFFAWMKWLGASSGSQQRYTNQQRLWTPIFVTCASPPVATMERLQIAARSKFVHAHAGKIRAIGRIVAVIAASSAPRRPGPSSR